MERELPLGAKIKCLGGRAGPADERDVPPVGSLPPRQAQVLFYLYHCEQDGRQVNIRAMSRWLRQSHVTVLGVIDRMEQKGFVHTETDPRDKRSRASCSPRRPTGPRRISGSGSGGPTRPWCGAFRPRSRPCWAV